MKSIRKMGLTPLLSQKRFSGLERLETLLRRYRTRRQNEKHRRELLKLGPHLLLDLGFDPQGRPLNLDRFKKMNAGVGEPLVSIRP